MSDQNHEERWLKMDLHIHAPLTSAYDKAGSHLLEVLREAQNKQLDVIGLVDHNTARSYEQLRLEMSRLAVLKEAGRLSPKEEAMWAEYQSILSSLLLLPGFELTTREGACLLALFPPETPAERLYALLLNLGIPMERLRESSPETRAEADVQTSCALVSQAGGIVIGAYADLNLLGLSGDTPSAAATGSSASAEVVVEAMAATDGSALPQGLLALETTLLPEEMPVSPRPLVWSSGAHCLGGRQEAPPGEMGELFTEVLLEAPSFEALRELLVRREPHRLRFPEKGRLRAYLERLRRVGSERLILCDSAVCDPTVAPSQVCRHVAALANEGGGVLLIGLSGEDVIGVVDPKAWSAMLLRQAREVIDPPPHLNLELLHFEGKEIIRVEVRTEAPPPYLTSDGVLYVRRGDETRAANRQELLNLVSAGRASTATPSGGLDLPQAGVEIVGTHLRDGVWFYDVRDLRVTSGVTRQRAKGLWAYAIERHESLRQGRVDVSPARWREDCGVWRAYRSGERYVFDLLHRDAAGRVDHVFYGVSEWGLTPHWRDVAELVQPTEEEEVGRPPEEEDPAKRERQVFQAVRQEPPKETPPETVETSSETPRELPQGTPLAQPAPSNIVEQPLAEPAAEQAPQPLGEKPPRTEAPIRSSPDAWGGRLPRWRGQAAVERVYWEGNHLFFDLAMRQEDGQVRYFRHVHHHQLSGTEGWVDLVRLSLPPTGVEVVRSTTSGDEILYQFRDKETGRVDPRVRRETDFLPDSPQAYAIRMFHQDRPLDESLVRWWGNIGYMRPTEERVDLVYRDESGRDHIYYAAERDLLVGEWRELLRVWEGD